MKKSLWGYNTREVDESIDSLESRNIQLERQVKQLTAELEKARTELEVSIESPSNTVAVDLQNETVINDLRAELDSVHEKNAQLKLANEKLLAEIAKKNAEVSEQTAAFSEVGNICRLAYEDMHNMKQKTRENLESFLQNFWNEWQKYQQQVLSLSEEIKLQQEESRKSFIASADYILQSYGSMEQKNRQFADNVSEISNTEEKLHADLVAILAELHEETMVDGNETENGKVERMVSNAASDMKGPEQAMNKADAFSILNAVKAASQETTENKGAKESREITEKSTVIPYGNSKEAMSVSSKVNIRNII